MGVNPFYGLSNDDPEVFRVLERGNREELDALIRRDPGCVVVRMKDPDQTALMVAAGMGREDLCDLLLGADAPVDAANRFGQTALHFALEFRSEHLAMRLLEKGANVHSAQSGGSTPLHIAAHRCGPAIVEALVRAGAKVDAQRFNESTPAIMAAFDGRTENVRVLAAHGADIVGCRCATNAGGPFEFCLTIAAEYGHRNLVEYLLASHAWRPEIMNVALKVASADGHLEIAQALVGKGADPFAPSGANNKSALYRAKQKKQQPLVDYFKTLKPPQSSK